MSAATARVDVPEQRRADVLWSVKDAAAYLRVPPKTLYEWRYKGDGLPPTGWAGTSATCPLRSMPGSDPSNPNPREEHSLWLVRGSTTAPRTRRTWRR